MLVIQIDRVHAKALERRVAGGADVLRPAVHSPEAAVGTAHVPELRRQDHLRAPARDGAARSEEHTSELQSQSNLVCPLLLVKTTQRFSRTAFLKPTTSSHPEVIVRSTRSGNIGVWSRVSRVTLITSIRSSRRQTPEREAPRC